jgi:hypothetical protein
MQMKPLTQFNNLSWWKPWWNKNRRNVPPHIKCYIWQLYSQHHTKWEKNESISSKVRNETRVSNLSTFIQHSFGIPSKSSKIGRRNKRYSVEKGRTQVIPICKWHNIPKRSQKLHQEKKEKQTWKPMEQNRRPRHKSRQVCPPDFWQTQPKTYNGEKTTFSTNFAGKTKYLHVENWN